MKLAAGFVAVAAASAAAMYFGVSTLTAADQPKHATSIARPATATPTAAEFARDLSGTANAYGVAHAAGARLTNTHCVQAARGRYMCSFAVVQTSGVTECHLIQARWTPQRASTITVTLAGRVARCGSVREALDSMP